MSVNALDPTKHFSEFNTALQGGASGTLTVAVRKATVKYNLGLATNDGLTAVYPQAAPAAKTVAVTLTAAELLGGLITAISGAGATAAYTLPLGTAMETAFIALKPDLAVNDSFDFSIINISTVATDTITLTANTGFTIVGQAIVDDNNATNTVASGMFRVRRTAANVYVAYRIA